jgi:hypothetical protein
LDLIGNGKKTNWKYYFAQYFQLAKLGAPHVDLQTEECQHVGAVRHGVFFP